jgi:hypothetical protein
MTPDHEQEQLYKDIAEIKRALLGDVRWGERGLIQHQRDNDRELNLIKAWMRGVTLKVVFVSGFVAGITTVLEYTIKSLVH